MEEECDEFSDIVNGNGKTLTMKVLGTEAPEFANTVKDGELKICAGF